jgi:hypothetical protein
MPKPWEEMSFDEKLEYMRQALVGTFSKFSAAAFASDVGDAVARLTREVARTTAAH